jgi:hypothetical protein
MMESDDRSPHPFTIPASGTDAGSISTQSQQGQGTEPMQNGDGRPERAIEAARTLMALVQDLVRQVDEQETQRRDLQERIRVLEEAARGYGTLRDQLRELVLRSITQDDLQTLQRVIQALEQDPNHIMVLASVAQQAGKLLAVVQGYARAQEALNR